MDTQKNQLRIIADPGKQELFIIREFDAPRELVFEAFSKEEIIVQFFGPDGLAMTYDHFSFSNGGSYRYSLTDGDGNVACTFHGSIHEVTAPERIIQTAELEGLPERGHVCLETMRFETLRGNRTRLTIQDVCMSVEDRDMMIASGMESGLQQGFDRLDKLLNQPA